MYVRIISFFIYNNFHRKCHITQIQSTKNLSNAYLFIYLSGIQYIIFWQKKIPIIPTGYNDNNIWTFYFLFKYTTRSDGIEYVIWVYAILNSRIVAILAKDLFPFYLTALVIHTIIVKHRIYHDSWWSYDLSALSYLCVVQLTYWASTYRRIESHTRVASKLSSAAESFAVLVGWLVDAVGRSAKSTRPTDLLTNDIIIL